MAGATGTLLSDIAPEQIAAQPIGAAPVASKKPPVKGHAKTPSKGRRKKIAMIRVKAHRRSFPTTQTPGASMASLTDSGAVPAGGTGDEAAY